MNLGGGVNAFLFPITLNYCDLSRYFIVFHCDSGRCERRSLRADTGTRSSPHGCTFLPTEAQVSGLDLHLNRHNDIKGFVCRCSECSKQAAVECADAERVPSRVQSLWEVLAVKRIQVYIMKLTVDLGHQVAVKLIKHRLGTWVGCLRRPLAAGAGSETRRIL